MKINLFWIGIIASFNVMADFSTDSIDNKTTIHVYDETISRNGSVVRYTAGSTDNILNRTETYDTSFNCDTHRDSSHFLAPGTLGRSAGDYACEFSNHVTEQNVPVVSDINFHKPIVGTAWEKINEYGIRMTASDYACVSPELAKLGYEYTMVSAIPLAKLKAAQDAYSTDKQYATTVVGCWSPSKHSYIAVRKHDQKILHDENFHIDGTWTKIQNSSLGVKS